MRKIVSHLRKQPHEVKTKILHLSTMLCAGILIFLWVLSIGNNFNSLEPSTQTGSVIEPFSALKDNLFDGLNSIKSETNGLKVKIPE